MLRFRRYHPLKMLPARIFSTKPKILSQRSSLDTTFPCSRKTWPIISGTFYLFTRHASEAGSSSSERCVKSLPESAILTILSWHEIFTWNSINYVYDHYLCGNHRNSKRSD